MEEFEIRYSQTFADSVEQMIERWKAVGLPIVQIQHYLTIVEAAIDSLRYWPNRFAEVSDQYGFNAATRRVLIGDQYAIFYRVDVKRKVVLVGSLFGQLQLNMHF